MNRRLAPCVFLAISAWSFVSIGFAQENVRLSASYQARVLPEGTVVAVLQRPALKADDGAYQPEFFVFDQYPSTKALLLAIDTLSTSARTNRSYPRSQPSGQLYFLYAQAPDGTLYWSYSAERNALKFDVIETGVMSVAPIRDADKREAVLRTFFLPTTEVVVIDRTHSPDSIETAAIERETELEAMQGGPPLVAAQALDTTGSPSLRPESEAKVDGHPDLTAGDDEGQRSPLLPFFILTAVMILGWLWLFVRLTAYRRSLLRLQVEIDTLQRLERRRSGTEHREAELHDRTESLSESVHLLAARFESFRAEMDVIRSRIDLG